jgi:hemerythrin-like domain-containing protein
MRCIDALNEEHHVLIRILKVIKAMGIKADVHQSFNEDDVKSIVKLLLAFVDSAHEMKEESALFPLVINRAPEELRKSLQARLFEHEQERYLIEGMRESALAGKSEDLAFDATRLAELLTEHVRKEFLLFQQIETLLQPDNDRKIVSEFETLDAGLRPKLKDVSDTLDKLERKYVQAA